MSDNIIDETCSCSGTCACNENLTEPSTEDLTKDLTEDTFQTTLSDYNITEESLNKDGSIAETSKPSIPVAEPAPYVPVELTKEQIEQNRQYREGAIILTVVIIFALIVTKLGGAW